MVFGEHARLIRSAALMVRYAEDLRNRIRVVPNAMSFPWQDVVDGSEKQVVSEDVVARVLDIAGLPVARGRLACTAAEAEEVAREVGFKVAMKAISPTITHRAAAGLVALDIATPTAVTETFHNFQDQAARLGAALDGVWVQHMFRGSVELLVTAFRDREFGVVVGVGMGGGLTEIIDDVVFTRAPIDADGAADLLTYLRTLRRLPSLLSAIQAKQVAAFIAGFSALAATAPWDQFTLEVNPLKVGDGVAAVDGLLIIG
jgi:acyl-CoA synthetase (NDP forming)